LARFPCTHPSLVPFTQCRTVIYYYYSPRKRHRVLATAEICARVAVATGEREYFSDVSDPPGHPVRPGLLAAVKKKRKIEETIVSAPFVRTKGDPRILIVVHYLAFPVFVYAHTTSCVRRIHTHTHTHIHLYVGMYIYILCVRYISAADFHFRGKKLCKVKCARRI